jgi:hypothetical protein
MNRAIPTIGLVLSLPFMTTTWSKDPDAQSCLNTLRSFFLSARAQPSGSRPTPPDMDVKALLGLQKSAIRTVLGPPDKREANYPPPECHAAQCWFQQTLKVSEDPAASDWLKTALVQAINRDPANAARNAEILCRIPQLRSAAALQGPRPLISTSK